MSSCTGVLPGGLPYSIGPVVRFARLPRVYDDVLEAV